MSMATLRLNRLTERLRPWWLPTFGLFGLFWLVIWRRGDPDFGWHLQAGRSILRHGIPAHDIFTYTAANFPWVNHEWLSDVLTAGLHGLGGYGLLTAVAAMLWTAALLVAARKPHWPVLALGFVAVLPYAAARPNAWTALGLGVLLWMLDRGWQWSVAGLFVVWANLHGGFVVGLLALGLAVVWNPRRYWWVLGLATLVTLVNPYGVHLYGEIWRTMSDASLRVSIEEWRPLAVNVLNGFYIVAYVVVVMVRGWRKALTLPTLLLVSALASMRQFPLFVVASLRWLSEAYERGLRFFGIRRGWRAWVLMMLATALAVVPAARVAWHPGNDLPDREIADLRARPCVGQLFNEYDYGGYIIWKLPGTKVYIDGRMPSWQLDGMNYFANWRDVLFKAEAAHREFVRYGVGCALVARKRDRLVKQLRSEGWRVTAQDGVAVLLRRPE